MTPYNPFSHPRKRLPVLLFALAMGLSACAQEGPPSPPPLTDEALSAVVAEPGVPRERLAREVDDLFASREAGETQALLVVHDGEVVAERYAPGFDAETRFLGWSMSKNITAVLMGMMIADGRVRLDDPAPISSWQRPGDPRSSITVRHLLQMRSGLQYARPRDAAYAGPTDRLLLLDGRDDMGGWAEAQPLEDEPGSTFQYSDASIMILADIAADLLEPDGSPDQRQRAMADFVDARLAVPLGMDSLVGEFDASGTLMGASHFWANARDWATFGEFLRQKGSVDGAQLVPRRWIDFMTRPSPALSTYGATLWINRHDGSEPSAIFSSRGAESIYAGIGRYGQFVIVSPEQELTVVRLGMTQRPEREALGEALADIFALYPSG